MSSSLRILVVDDSLSMRLVVGQLLTNLGHQVIGEAKDGLEALQLYMEHKPDLVMLDLVMPKFDGKKTLKKILQVDAQAQIIICSSLGSEGDIQYCLREGAKFYLQKPYEIAGVKTAINSLSEPVA
jgi:two-component system chemotaxis response regulator CheY